MALVLFAAISSELQLIFSTLGLLGCAEPLVAKDVMRTPGVCLVTSVQISANPRIVKEATALSEAGYDVHVIATEGTQSRQFDEAILSLAQWKYTIVSRGSILAYAWRTLRQRVVRKSISIRRRVGLNWAVIAHHRLTDKLAKTACRNSANLYIAHHLAALPAAAVAARRNNAKLGFDAEDFHSSELTIEQQDAGDQYARQAIEATLLPACDMLTTAAPGIAGEYEKIYGVKMRTILNVFPISYALSHATPIRRVSNGSLSLYWFSRVVGPGRGLEALIRAMAHSKTNVSLTMRGNVTPTYRQDLEDLARRLGIIEKITFLPFAAPSEMVRLAVDYDAGLAIEPGITRNNQLALSNKIFVYLLAGLPVLLSQTPAQKSFACELGQSARQVDLDDPVDTAKRLDEFAANSEARAEARAAAWRLGRERFNWDLEKFRFLELVENHIGPASNRAQ